MTRAPEHVAVDTLVRFLDREVGAPDRARVETHVATCAECADRLAKLGRRTRALSHVLRTVDAVPPEPFSFPSSRGSLSAGRTVWTLRRGILAAAGLTAVLVVSVAPVRAWIVRQARLLRPVTPSTIEPAPAPAPVAPARPSATVTFVPESPIVTVRIPARQVRGVLTLRRSAEPSATVLIVDGDRETVVVRPNGVTLDNNAGSSASYVVDLPLTVTSVVVHIGSTERHALDWAGASVPARFDLAVPSRQNR